MRSFLVLQGRLLQFPRRVPFVPYLLLLFLLLNVSVAVEIKEFSATPPKQPPTINDNPGGGGGGPAGPFYLPLRSDKAVDFPFENIEDEEDWSDNHYAKSYVVSCATLRLGQFRCNDTLHVDPATQQLQGCTKHNLAPVPCEASPGLICKETNTSTFTKQFPCKFTNGYRYDTALLLSVFLGWLGADRLYLGHVGMGAVKMATLGFFFIGHLVDIILIATQTVKPIDSSNYIVGFYGPSVQSVRPDNFTLIVRRQDWFTE